VISPEDRWRLILGRERERLRERALRAGIALDELYGAGRGEGAGSRLDGDGAEPGQLGVREWLDELRDLFGERVAEQVVGRAAEQGRSQALLELDPESVAPSVGLLQELLSLKGGLPPDRLARLRRLVDRVVRDLVRELTSRLRPALTGGVVARPTSRPGGPLDLSRTVARSLRTVRFREDGSPQLVPDRLVFRTRARRSLDWRVVLVVDVSGSMEASVVYAALVAAILSGLPAVTTNFVAFSSEVLDLSEKVADPLGLLLEVSVGGGTDIARGLRYARELVTVPARTLLVLVTDFEEGGPVEPLLAEVRTVAESGARPLGLAALDDRGQPRYSRAVAEEVVAAGMPVAALSPLELARWIGEQIR
jgi:Mg-chelatase subunit ChlD